MIRPLEVARAKARESRAELGGSNKELLDRLLNHLLNSHGIDVQPVNAKKFLGGGRAEYNPVEKSIYYDRNFDERPEEKFEVIAHEYGHLKLHHELMTRSSGDSLRGSVFFESGASAVARYSPRLLEEAEATAFATEFICPAQEVFEQWQTEWMIALGELQERYSVSRELVLIQLAEGLYRSLTSDASSTKANRNEITPTKEQETAATCCGRPVLVDAGPGTGKTLTLVHRISFLLDEKHADPEKILVLTFSNEAAAELRERVEARHGKEIAKRLFVLTFHGFGAQLLNLFGDRLGLGANYSIIDESTQEELVNDLLGNIECDAILDIRKPEETARLVIQEINYLKDRLVDSVELKNVLEKWRSSSEEEGTYKRAQALYRVFEVYEDAKRKNAQVDFADLILLPKKILENNPDVQTNVREQYPWVLVDEYQDVSRGMALLLKAICDDTNPPWVVGDARQAIYRFRGAAPENVLQFEKDFLGATLFHLHGNYRSSPPIIAAANHLAALMEDPNFKGEPHERWKPARTVEPLGDPAVLLARAVSDAAEHRGVVNQIKEWIAAEIPPEDIAVLARRNIDVRNVAIALKKSGIRTVTSGLLTAEGAGGDMAAVLSVVDSQSAIPRLVYALYRESSSSEVLNKVIDQLLSCDLDADVEPTWQGSENVVEIAAECWIILGRLREHISSGDAWIVLCDFLFFSTSYLRSLLEHLTEAEAAVQLDEVLSAL